MNKDRVEELWIEILRKYKSVAACAREMGWTRQRLNRIVCGQKNPTVSDVNAIARAIDRDAAEVYLIFLKSESTNRQHFEHSA